jgi:hypothetical protein
VTGIEAFAALRNGRKVRRLSWFNGLYAFIQDSKIIVCRGNDKKVQGTANIEQFLKDDWEELT